MQNLQKFSNDINMTIDIIIKPSHLSSKKYDAIIDGKKTVPFGAKV